MGTIEQRNTSKKSASKELNLKKGAVGFEPTIKCIKNKRVILFGYAPKKFEDQKVKRIKKAIINANRAIASVKAKPKIA